MLQLLDDDTCKVWRLTIVTGRSSAKGHCTGDHCKASPCTRHTRDGYWVQAARGLALEGKRGTYIYAADVS